MQKINLNPKNDIYTKLVECFSFNPDEPYLQNDGVERILTGKQKVVLYGAGGFGLDFMLRVANRNTLDICCVLDMKFATISDFFGYKAMNLDTFLASQYNPSELEVLICTSRNNLFNEISDLLKDVGFKKIRALNDFYSIQLLYPPPELIKNPKKFYKKSQNRILEAYSLFDDKVSCESYYRCIKTHVTQDYVPMIEFSEAEQYIPNDIDLKKGLTRIINCGAYDGDTIKKLIAKNGRADSVACFEPNLITFQKLSSYIREDADSIAKHLILFPCGVGQSTALLEFSQDGAASSTCSTKERGDKTHIPVVKLDDVLPNFAPTYINMDIEGAELSALRGSEKTIRSYKPDLAICLYHTPNHFWEIPLYLNELNLGYKFYLRNYTSFTNESVLYAIT